MIVFHRILEHHCDESLLSYSYLWTTASHTTK